MLDIKEAYILGKYQRENEKQNFLCDLDIRLTLNSVNLEAIEKEFRSIESYDNIEIISDANKQNQISVKIRYTTNNHQKNDYVRAVEKYFNVYSIASKTYTENYFQGLQVSYNLEYNKLQRIASINLLATTDGSLIEFLTTDVNKLNEDVLKSLISNLWFITSFSFVMKYNLFSFSSKLYITNSFNDIVNVETLNDRTITIKNEFMKNYILDISTDLHTRVRYEFLKEQIKAKEIIYTYKKML